VSRPGNARVAGRPAVTVEPLPLPDDPRLALMRARWPIDYAPRGWPRSAWLHDFEAILREYYPHASSDQLTLTARLAAPFPLALPGVP
jgi:hypothetical protein